MDFSQTHEAIELSFNQTRKGDFLEKNKVMIYSKEGRHLRVMNIRDEKKDCRSSLCVFFPRSDVRVPMLVPQPRDPDVQLSACFSLSAGYDNNVVERAVTSRCKIIKVKPDTVEANHNTAR
ncbi:hypothetical protein CAPTEDRAFT_185287 [Capitella teleta]|uniref:Uncharacterized protein n=1 Tax=Capitella teleta TaxID=283909 RepID=R7T5E6_CAPTE|nr:hypothetical protein CAPTEDRAFT_185287 [Capitella teleta]|eukprot:ELT88343.1 hypothetical protein CAPTEDRAFT_185287 [Capitella teleta]